MPPSTFIGDFFDSPTLDPAGGRKEIHHDLGLLGLMSQIGGQCLGPFGQDSIQSRSTTLPPWPPTQRRSNPSRPASCPPSRSASRTSAPARPRPPRAGASRPSSA